MKSILVVVFLVFSFSAFSAYDDIDQLSHVIRNFESYSEDLAAELEEVEKKLEDLKRLSKNLSVSVHNKKIQVNDIIQRYQQLEEQLEQCNQSK